MPPTLLGLISVSPFMGQRGPWADGGAAARKTTALCPGAGRCADPADLADLAGADLHVIGARYRLPARSRRACHWSPAETRDWQGCAHYGADLVVDKTGSRARRRYT